ncbi:hypothetical protein PFISCL1PPCAC_2691, partial [Pristionchus fissidentatus]
RPAKSIIDGQHLPPTHTEENVRSTKDMIPRPSDIFVCTYPKCGTTWIQHIVLQLLGNTDYERTNSTKAMCHESPMIESVGAGYCETIAEPRVLKTHFSYKDAPKGGGAKYIYSVRNPKDCLTSFFHHHRNFKHYMFEHGQFNTFYELFMTGEVSYGDYFDHLIDWLDGMQNGQENILLVKYEDMLVDLRSSIVKIAEFIGGKAAELIKDEEELTRIVEASTLSAMKGNQQRWFPKELQTGEFIRKGGSRDWKNHLSFEQNNRLDKRFNERLSSTVAADWWKEEMAWDVIDSRSAYA